MADACSFLGGGGAKGIQMEHQGPFYLLQPRAKVHMKNDPSHPSNVSWLLTHTNVHQVTEACYSHSNPRHLPFLFEKRPTNYNE